MAIHRKEDLVPDSNENGITMTSLSGPERGDKMITVKELFLNQVLRFQFIYILM